MPIIQYKELNFHSKSESIIAIAESICIEYMEQGYSLTLRQLYYQFVARGHIENNIKEYKKLGSIINDARLAGRLDWNYIEDRTRNLEALPTWDSPKDILKGCAEQFKYDYWAAQYTRVEVWVEKEALVGVIERVAFKYRVPYFACRGYTSQSEAWRAGQRFMGYNQNGQAVKVIHLGDHDPSGIDMTRDNEERLQMFSDMGDVEIIRVALNENQVKRYNPPPNPAKLTDTRAADYINKFGESSWELDALDPKIIDKLISDEIKKYIDANKWEEDIEREKKARERLAKMANNWRD